MIATGTQVQIVHNDVLATAIALVWLVGMTNAFNLLDNMDGLAATLAAIACAYFAIDAFTRHPNPLVKVLSLSVALACCGFLPFNLRPGRAPRVFMGDSGSQVIGFALAALSLSASWKLAGTTVATLLLPMIVLADPDPRHDAGHGRPPARAAADLAGRHATTRRTGSSTTGCRRSAPSSCSRFSPASVPRASPTTCSPTHA